MANKKSKYRPFRLHISKDNQYYFCIVAKNGNIIATSETYKQKQSVTKAITAIQKACKSEGPVFVEVIDEY